MQNDGLNDGLFLAFGDCGTNILVNLKGELSRFVGGHAGNEYYQQMFEGTQYLAANTNQPSLVRLQAEHSDITTALLVTGNSKTDGRGAGNDPVRARAALAKSVDALMPYIRRAKWVIVLLGLGKGTGTGCAELIAKTLADNHKLGFIIVARPSLDRHEIGKTQFDRANDAIEALRSVNLRFIQILNDEAYTDDDSDELTPEEAYAKLNLLVAQMLRAFALFLSYPEQVDINDFLSIYAGNGLAWPGYTKLDTSSNDAFAESLKGVADCLKPKYYQQAAATSGCLVIIEGKITNKQLASLRGVVNETLGHDNENYTAFYARYPGIEEGKIHVTIIAFEDTGIHEFPEIEFGEQKGASDRPAARVLSIHPSSATPIPMPIPTSQPEPEKIEPIIASVSAVMSPDISEDELDEALFRMSYGVVATPLNGATAVVAAAPPKPKPKPSSPASARPKTGVEELAERYKSMESFKDLDEVLTALRHYNVHATNLLKSHTVLEGISPEKVIERLKDIGKHADIMSSAWKDHLLDLLIVYFENNKSLKSRWVKNTTTREEIEVSLRTTQNQLDHMSTWIVHDLNIRSHIDLIHEIVRIFGQDRISKALDAFEANKGGFIKKFFKKHA